MDTIDIILDALEVAQVHSEDSQLQGLASELRALLCQKLTSRSNDEWILSEFERNPEQWRKSLRKMLFEARADQDERLYLKAAHIIAIAPEQGQPFGSAPDLEPERDDRSLTEPDEDQYPPTTVRPSTPPPLSGLPTPSPTPLFPDNSPPPAQFQCSNTSSQRQTRTAFGWSRLVQWISQTPQSSPISLEDELRRLETGKILLSAPQSMKLGISSRVKVRISRSETQTLFDDLSPTEADQAEVRDIKVGKWMHVALQGDDFKIQALTDEEQLILDDVAFWDWSVKPLKAGLRKLWIRVTVTVKSNSEQARKQLPVLEKEITVQINPIHFATNFVTQHWQWIVASAAIPIAGLLLKK